MTWIVGATSPFGHATLVSDVRVSWPDKSGGDFIQKAFGVGRYLTAGFAGSVRIGFHLISDLTSRLAIEDERLAWHPVEVVQAWAPIAASIFSNHSDTERALGCHLLIAGVSPTENNGTSPFAVPYLMTPKSPTFRPGFSRRGMAALQIGSGRRQSSYRELVRAQFRDPRFATNFGSWGSANFGSMLGYLLGQVVTENPVAGVSPHLHVVSCSRGMIYEGTNNFSVIDDDREIPKLTMPRVAKSYEEFLSLVKERGKNADAASS